MSAALDFAPDAEKRPKNSMEEATTSAILGDARAVRGILLDLTAKTACRTVTNFR
jgi:hypothetical protein